MRTIFDSCSNSNESSRLPRIETLNDAVTSGDAPGSIRFDMATDPGEYMQEKPRLAGDAELRRAGADELMACDEMSSAFLVDAVFPSQPIGQLRVESCVLERAQSQSFKADVFTLIDSRLERCNFANSDWGRARVRRVEAQHCKFTGLSAADSDFRSLRLSDCVVDLSVFHRSVFRACLFERCNLCEADFDGADLSGCCFKECDLRGVNLSRAKVNGADFRTCEVEGLSASADGLRGAIFDASQSPALARLLGVDLR